MASKARVLHHAGCLWARALVICLAFWVFALGDYARGATPALVITSQPKNQTLYIGDEIVLHVEVVGAGPLGYEWRQNGRTILPFGLGTSTLIVSNAAPSDSGAYTVAVTNSVPEARIISARAIVSVLASPVRIQNVSILQEECVPPNHAIDPDERVTISLSLLSTNASKLTNLLATLISETFLTEVSDPQVYSDVLSGTPTALKEFTFRAGGICGQGLNLRFRLTSGAQRLGVLNYTTHFGTDSGDCCGAHRSADLGVSVDAYPPSIHLPQTSTFALSLTNRGPDEAAAVRALYTLPPSTIFVSAETSFGTWRLEGGQLKFDLGTLVPAQDVRIMVSAQALGPGEMTNQFTVISQTSDPNPNNNAAMWQQRIRPAGVTLNFDNLNVSESVANPSILTDYLLTNGIVLKWDASKNGIGVGQNENEARGGSLPNAFLALSKRENDNLTFSLSFQRSLDHFEWTRLARVPVDPASPGFVRNWSIRAYNNLGFEIGVAQQDLCDSEDCSLSGRATQLSLDSPGIRSVVISATGPQPSLALDDWILLYSDSNQSPQIHWVAPLDGAALRSSLPISISLTATDPDDLIAKVEVYDGDQLIQTLHEPPYTFLWKGPSIGYHRLMGVATDTRGTATASPLIHVTVDLPEILDQPISQKVLLNGSAVFRVSASDPASLRYQWFKNGAVLTGANEASLLLTPLQLEDGADYWVEISNNFGTIRSQTAHLEVVEGTAESFELSNNPRPDFWVTDGIVHSVVETNGLVYIKGSFTNIYQNLGRPAVFDAIDGSILPGFPQISGDVRAVVSDGEGGFFVGGYFNIAGLSTVTNLVRLNAVGEVDPRWQPALQGPVFSLALQDGTLFAGGADLVVNGQTRGIAAAFDAKTGALTPWIPALTNRFPVSPLPALQPDFSALFSRESSPRSNATAGPPPRPLALDGGGNDPTVVTPIFVDLFPVFSTFYQPSGVLSMAALGTKLYVAGVFNSIGGLPRRGMAALDTRTGAVLPWIANIGSSTPDTSAPSGVSGMVIADQRLYLCGDLDSVNGVPRHNLAATDLNSGAVLQWNPQVNGKVNAIGFACGVLVVGGEFTQIGGQSRRNLAALDPSTGLATDWNPDVDGPVTSLTTLFNTVYIGGTFASIGGQPRSGTAAIDLASGTARAWQADSGIGVAAIAADPKKIWAAGNFSFIGKSVTNFAAFNAKTGFPVDWDATPEILQTLLSEPNQTLPCRFDFLDQTPDLMQKTINRVRPWTNMFFLGGNFTHINGIARENLFAATCSPTPTLLPWNPGADREVNDIQPGEDQVYIGGTFLRTGGQIQPGFAAFPLRGAPQIATAPRGGVVITNGFFTFSVQARGAGPLSYQWFFEDKIIMNATNRILALGPVARTNAGSYAVLVSNPLGSLLSPAANLTVVEPIQIVSQPKSVTAPHGTTIALKVEATSHPTPLYQWRINGVNIPGADQPTYTIPNADPTNGGAYSVIVANPGGVVRSQTAEVIIQTPALPFTDMFSDHVTIREPEGIGSGSNLEASREVGETNHVHKMGGRSVWISWTAPTNGIATFSTRGSTFDTLLAIYTGSRLGNLQSVAEDEDRGEFATSLTAFNAVKGTEYLIAIDGFAGDSGHIVLSWNLDTTTVPFPRILVQPKDQSVPAGSDVAFSVSTATSASPEGYQWFFNCMEIPGETNSILRLHNVQLADVGVYSVHVTNASTRFIESARAVLEIGARSSVLARDKFEDLFEIGTLTNSVLGGGGVQLQDISPPEQGIIQINNTSEGTQIVSNFKGGTQAREPNHCNVIGGASLWFRMRAEVDGRIAVHTMGSTLDTVVGVYQMIDFRTLREVACDNDSGMDGIRSLARFDAVKNQDYFVAVDSVGGKEGIIQLHWKMGLQAQLNGPSQLTSIQVGHPLTLRVGVTESSDTPGYQWRFQQQAIAGATNPILTITSADLANTGIYSVVLSNLFGVTTNVAASVTILPPALRIGSLLPNGSIQLRLDGASRAWYALQRTTNMADWTELTRFIPSNSISTFELKPNEQHLQFYRVVPAD